MVLLLNGRKEAIIYSGSVLQVLQCGYSKAAKDWMVLEEQLFHRRGPWGVVSQSLEPRWILDCYEGPSRMRRRIQQASNRATVMRMKSEVESFYRKCANSVVVGDEFIFPYSPLSSDSHQLIYQFALLCIWNPMS